MSHSPPQAQGIRGYACHLYLTVGFLPPTESYDRCVVLIRAEENKYYCLEIPVRTLAEQQPKSLVYLLDRCCLCLAMQDTSYARLDADKLLDVPGCRKHSVYKDSDGTLWCVWQLGSLLACRTPGSTF